MVIGMRAIAAIGIGLVLGLAACGSDDPAPVAPSTDAAIDSSKMDAPSDRTGDRVTTPDGSSDASPDRSDAGVDESVAPDVGRDSLPEADVGVDASPADMGVDSPDDGPADTNVERSEGEERSEGKDAPVDAPDVSPNPDVSLDVADAPGEANAIEAEAGDGAPELPGHKVGSACAADADCNGAKAFCFDGFCTQPCGQDTPVTDCNAPGLADRDGPYGGIYTCWPLGPNYTPLCWPNGSGAPCGDGGACPRPDESCLRGRCQYTMPSGEPRTIAKCQRDGDCRQGESCAVIGNLDPNGYRGDGGCLWGGNPPNIRKHAGELCTLGSECGGLWCLEGTCLGLCRADDDCPAGHKCIDRGTRAHDLDEASSIFYGMCYPWPGSRTACAANSSCPAGELCEPYLKLSSNELRFETAGGCKAFANPAGGAVGASCSRDDECQRGPCLVNGLTGVGYCLAGCVGGDADCGRGTSCRLISLGVLDPGMPENDYRQPFCVQTGVGAPCLWQSGCVKCSRHSDCNPDQGVYCQWDNAAAPTGICRDYFGRCADPCRMNCDFGEACPAGSTCVAVTGVDSYCRDDATGGCVRADFPQVLTYLDGMCGDEQYPLSGGRAIEQKDLCYYYGLPGGQPTFLCGQQCAPGSSCSSIASSDDGGIPTTCRTVYEYGEPIADAGVSGGAARTPNQCAPSDAFVGR